VAAAGAESAVYDWLVVVGSHRMHAGIGTLYIGIPDLPAVDILNLIR